MKHSPFYPAKPISKEDPKGKKFADDRLRAALAEVLNRSLEPAQPNRQRLTTELHLLNLEIRTLLKGRRDLKRKLDQLDG